MSFASGAGADERAHHRGGPVLGPGDVPRHEPRGARRTRRGQAAAGDGAPRLDLDARLLWVQLPRVGYGADPGSKPRAGPVPPGPRFPSYHPSRIWPAVIGRRLASGPACSATLRTPGTKCSLPGSLARPPGGWCITGCRPCSRISWPAASASPRSRPAPTSIRARASSPGSTLARPRHSGPGSWPSVVIARIRWTGRRRRTRWRPEDSSDRGSFLE